MNGIWLLAGIAVFAIALVVVYALLKVASDTDRAMRHTEKMFNPLSDVFVTQTGQDPP